MKEIKSHEEMMSLLDERNQIKEKIKACDSMLERVKLEMKLKSVSSKLLSGDFKTY